MLSDLAFPTVRAKKATGDRLLAGGGGKWYHFGDPRQENTVEAILPSGGFTAALDLGVGAFFSVLGLAFDAHGNLFGALEVNGPAGGLVHIDTATGAVTPPLAAWPRCHFWAYPPITSVSRISGSIARLAARQVRAAGDRCRVPA